MYDIVRDLEDTGTVRCNCCGCQFDWDVHTEQNLLWNKEKAVLELQCPACSKILIKHKCIDNGGMFFGNCKICGREMG